MFDTHKLNETGFQKMATYKKTMADAVKAVSSIMPEGRDRAIFITKMEEGIFFGAKVIASAPENHTEVTSY